MSEDIYVITTEDVEAVLYDCFRDWTDDKKNKCIEYVHSRITLDYYNAIKKLIETYDEEYQEEQQSNEDVRAEEKYQNRKDDYHV